MADLRAAMFPRLSNFTHHESGIRRVVEAYERLLPKYGITLVDADASCDVVIGHAASYPSPDVLVCHGLYWTDDYVPAAHELRANAVIAAAARQANQITVPSGWVAEAFQRDMHLQPHVIGHGINWSDWQHSQENSGYVLWNKNRIYDVCNPEAVNHLARKFINLRFITTFALDGVTPNVETVGIVPNAKMKRYIQRAGVYLSTVKETFGIGVLEAMAAGVPVLGFDYGGNRDLVQHGVNGFLARPGDYEALEEGLHYCFQYRDQLGANGRELAKAWTWEKAVEQMAQVVHLAASPQPPLVSIVIPSYNYGTEDKLGRAIRSVLSQAYLQWQLIVVDDGSTDDGATRRLVETYQSQQPGIIYWRQENQGVAVARNTGIEHTAGKYICCLDADDAIQPDFLDTTVAELEQRRDVGIAYTGLTYIKPNGETGISPWPGPYDFERFCQKQNQVPTCCVYRRSMWERLGGYRQRYAPLGAGAEDAEFFLRGGAYGFAGRKVTDAGMFLYSWLSGRVSGNREYHEPDWTYLHPWTKDGIHPFASVAKPKHISHRVRQYDEPIVSVIVPVGPQHAGRLWDALDSLEAQTLRKWEVIVVDDSPDFQLAQDSHHHRLRTAYPYIKLVHNHGKGAGAARNTGAEIARSGLLLFLDADDMLEPNALALMVDYHNLNGGVIYGDYIGISTLSPEMVEKARNEKRLIQQDPRYGDCYIQYHASAYECERACRQPDAKDMYIWNLISSLTPKRYHDQIGGFDEQMDSWEDWDYWLRMARAGICFHHLTANTVVYRFNTGSRRSSGLHDYQYLIEYLTRKYKGAPLMP